MLIVLVIVLSIFLIVTSAVLVRATKVNNTLRAEKRKLISDLAGWARACTKLEGEITLLRAPAFVKHVPNQNGYCSECGHIITSLLERCQGRP